MKRNNNRKTQISSEDNPDLITTDSELNSYFTDTYLCVYKKNGKLKTIEDLKSEKIKLDNRICYLKNVNKKEILLKMNNEKFNEALHNLKEIRNNASSEESEDEDISEELQVINKGKFKKQTHLLDNETTSNPSLRSKSRQSSIKEHPLQLNDIEDNVLDEFKITDKDIEESSHEDEQNHDENFQNEKITLNKDNQVTVSNIKNQVTVTDTTILSTTVQRNEYYMNKHSEIIKFLNENKKITTKEKDKLQNILYNLLQTFTEQNLQITSIAKEIEMYKKFERKTYAETTRTTQNIVNKEVLTDIMNNTQKTTYAITVKPKKKQNNITTMKDIKTNINPSQINITVEKVKNISDGGILINTKTKNDIDKLEKELNKNKEIRGKYNIAIPKKRNPQIILFNVTNDVSNDEIISEMMDKYDITKKEDISVKLRQNFRYKNSSNWILELSPQIYKKLEPNKINIGWQKIFYREYLKPTRCYNCSRYGHKGQTCRNNKTCLKCGSTNHEFENCNTNEPNCPNCTFHNMKFKTNIPTNHMSSDSKCFCWLNEKKKIIARTDYGEE